MEQRDVGTVGHDFAVKREKIRIDLHAEHGSGPDPHKAIEIYGSRVLPALVRQTTR